MLLWTYIAKICACETVFVCLCICWPCLVSPPLLNKGSLLSQRIVLAFHLRRSVKSRIIAHEFNLGPPQPFCSSLSFWFFSSRLWCLSVKSFESAAKLRSLLQCDSGDDTLPGQRNRCKVRVTRSNENVRHQLLWDLTLPWLSHCTHVVAWLLV